MGNVNTSITFQLVTDAERMGLMSCSECGAVVVAKDMRRHADWHLTVLVATEQPRHPTED